MKISIILPTYNERESITKLIRSIENYLSLKRLSYELIVVDDNSPDGTGRIAQQMAKESSKVKAFIRIEERGLASAIRYGISKSSGDRIVVMDTDFNHHPKVIPQMVKFSEYYDMIIGSRFVMGGGMADVKRYYFSYLYNFLIRIILRTQIEDNLSGFFLIKRKRLLDLDLDKIFYGYGDYFFRLLFFAWRKGFTMIEIPVFYGLRPYGQSKSSFLKMLIGYTISVLRLRLRKR